MTAGVTPRPPCRPARVPAAVRPAPRRAAPFPRARPPTAPAPRVAPTKPRVRPRRRRRARFPVRAPSPPVAPRAPKRAPFLAHRPVRAAAARRVPPPRSSAPAVLPRQTRPGVPVTGTARPGKPRHGAVRAPVCLAPAPAKPTVLLGFRALPCGSVLGEGGSNPCEPHGGDRGPLSREFPTNSRARGFAPKRKFQPSIWAAVSIGPTIARRQPNEHANEPAADRR